MIIIRFSNISGFSLNSFCCISRLTTAFFAAATVPPVSVVELFESIDIVDVSSNDVDGFFMSNRFFRRKLLLMPFGECIVFAAAFFWNFAAFAFC